MIARFLVAFFLALHAIASPEAARQFVLDGSEAVDRKEYSTAIELFTKAIDQDVTDAHSYACRGYCFSSLDKHDEALRDFNAAIAAFVKQTQNPNDKWLAHVFCRRAWAYERAGRFKDAIADYLKTMELDSEVPDAHGNAAWIFATATDASLRDPAKALNYAMAEANLPGRRIPEVLDTLAAAFAANSHFAEAVRHLKEAIAMTKDPEDKKEYQARLQLYEANKPYIEPPKQ